MTGEQRGDAFYFVRCLDLEYLKFKSEKSDRERDSGKGKKDGKSR